MTINSAKGLEALREAWLARWPDALAIWSKYTRLRSPTLCLSDRDAAAEGLTDSFAMIRLDDQAVVVNLAKVAANHLEDYPVEIFAHEIGHHVLAPATLNDHARMIARMRWALPTIESRAPMVANLYSDLLINDRLQRSGGLRLADVYLHLTEGRAAGAVWALYMRIYEILWSRPRGTLRGGKVNDRLEGDAQLGARLIRSYARDWLEGSGRFAALFLPHLLEDRESEAITRKWFDTENAGTGGDPSGLADEDPGERSGAIHPALDPDLADLPIDGGEEAGQAPPPTEVESNAPARGQARDPFQYGEILRAMGINVSDHDAAVRYYREKASRSLIPFPSRRIPEGADPLPEGLEPWDFGEPIDQADWIQTILQSPRVVPGMTTVQRVWGTTEGREEKRAPIDLDLYVDSSGSMANPQRMLSYPALAGAILCLSALRGGARVQATLWSAREQVTSTDGFVLDEEAILRVLTGYYGGATAFPIPMLRRTYEHRKPSDRPVHILVISDDGVSTLFDQDERGKQGWDVAAMALERARGGGTFVLNLPDNWEASTGFGGAFGTIRRARETQGWRVYRVASWEELVAFARDFSRAQYGEEAK